MKSGRGLATKALLASEGVVNKKIKCHIILLLTPTVNFYATGLKIAFILA